MKKIILILVALCAVNMASAQLPSVTVENMKGESVNVQDLASDGKPMIISFWATWCHNCVLELKAMHENLDEWRDTADFKIVAVSIDDARSTSKAKTMASGNGWTEDFTILLDKNQDLKRAMNVNLIPHTFVVDGEGNIIYSHTSYTPGSEWELFEKIKGL